MKVHIEVSDWLKRYTGGTVSLQVEVVEGQTVYDLVAGLGIPRNEIGFAVVREINEETGKTVDEKYPVTEGMNIKVYHFIVGG